jgi:6-phosphogluconolactonase (cycloisomerase 2 family)
MLSLNLLLGLAPVFGGGPAIPDLIADDAAWPGGSATFLIDGTASVPPLVDYLLVDLALLPAPLPLPPYGTLHLAGSTALLTLAGDGSGAFEIPIPDTPGIAGQTLHAQALGLMPAGVSFQYRLSEPTSVPIVPSPPPATRLLAVANLGDGAVGFIGVDSDGPRSRHLGYAQLGGALRAMDAAPLGDRLFTLDTVAGLLHTQSIDVADGDWTASSVTSAGSGASDVLADPSGRFVYVAASGENAIRQYALDASGDPQPMTPASVATGARPTSLACDSSGAWVFALAPEAGLLVAHAADPVSGALTVAAALPVPGAPARIAVSDAGDFVHVADPETGALTTWAFDTSLGSFDPAAVGSVPISPTTVDVALHPNGRLLYLLDAATSTLSWHAVDPGGGTVDPIANGSASTAEGPLRLEFDPRGARLFTLSPFVNELRVHAADPLTGAIELVQRLRQRELPLDLVPLCGASPTSMRSRVCLVAHEVTSELRTYQLDLAAGKLFDAGSSSATTVGATAMSLERRTGDLLTAEGASGAGAFKFNPQNFAISAYGTLSVGSAPSDVAIDRSGRFAWSTEAAANRLRRYDLTVMSPIELGPLDPLVAEGPRALAVTPEGRHLLVVGESNSRLEVLRIGPDGTLESKGSVQTVGAPRDVAAHPSGRFALVSCRNPNRLEVFALGPDGASPTSLGAANVGSQPGQVVTDPTGRWAFVANEGSNSISVFEVDLEDGSLTLVETQGLANSPADLAVEASGQALVVTVPTPNLFQMLSIDPQTGALNGLGLSLAAGTGPGPLVASLDLD